MATRRAPRVAPGAVKVLVRKPTAEELQRKQHAQEDLEQAKLTLHVRSLQQQNHLLVSVPPSFPVAADPRFASLFGHFSQEFLDLRFDEMQDSFGSHRESRSRLIAKSLLETFEATIMRVLHNSLKIGSAAAAIDVEEDTDENNVDSPKNSSNNGSPDSILSLLERCVEPLHESAALETMDEMLLELCKKVELDPCLAREKLTQPQVAGINSIAIDACVQNGCLCAVATWRLEVCKACSSAIMPIVAKVERIVREFCLLAQQSQQSDSNSSSSSSSSSAQAACAALADIEREMVLFRRIIDSWRHCVRDLSFLMTTATTSLQNLKSFAAGEALMYQAKVLRGDAAREEAHLLSTAHVVHELLSRNFLAAVNALQHHKKTESVALLSSASGNRKRRGGDKVKNQQQQQQQPDVVPPPPYSSEARVGKAELKSGSEHRSGRGGAGRRSGRSAGAGAGRGDTTPLSSSSPTSPTKFVDAEYRRSDLPVVTDRSQMPLQQRPAMRDVQMFKVKKKQNPEEENEPRLVENNNHNNSSQDDDLSCCGSSVGGHLSSNDDDASDPAAVPSIPAARSATLLSSVLAALSPAGIDRLVMVRSAELPLSSSSSSVSSSGGGPVVSFSAATKQYKSALIDAPWRGSAYERLASLYAKFPLAFSEQQQPQSSSASPSCQIVHLFVRAASSSLDASASSLERALRHMRKTAREVRRSLKKRSSSTSTVVAAASLASYVENGLVSLEDAVVAATSPILQPIASTGEDSALLLCSSEIETWASEMRQLSLLVLAKTRRQQQQQQQQKSSSSLDSDSAMLLLRVAEIVLVACGAAVSRQGGGGGADDKREQIRLSIPIVLAEVFCDTLLLQQQGSAGQSSLPTAISLLVEASMRLGLKAAAASGQPTRSSQNQQVLYEDDEDEVVFVPQQQQQQSSSSLLGETLTRLRQKLLLVRDRCDAEFLAGASSGDGIQGHQATENRHFVSTADPSLYITCDDSQLFGLPADASLLVQRDSVWFSDKLSPPISSASAPLRRAVLRNATKVSPGDFRVLAAGTRTPPHRHDDEPRHYADGEQTVALRLKRLSDIVSKVLFN